MNIFDFAIEFERELHDYYQEKVKMHQMNI